MHRAASVYPLEPDTAPSNDCLKSQLKPLEGKILQHIHTLMPSEEALSLPSLARAQNWRLQCPFSDVMADLNLRGKEAIACISNLLPASFHAKEKLRTRTQYCNLIPN